MSSATELEQKKIDQIAHFLQHGGIVKKFNFPRLYLPNLPGYKPKYYEEIGQMIASKRIRVYEGNGEIPGAKAFYKMGSNCLYLTSETKPLNTPDHWSTIAHEATHMIQDMKKWRMTMQEMEADAHFAQALFLHYKNGFLSGGLMQTFTSAAKDFAAGNMREFKKKCQAMLGEAGNKYYGKKGYEKLYIKERQDGIP
ncbi:hypothetical protein Pan97_25900 [Bremerella volcania]|uniref:Uncharacterized protein n=1 Tax=Bremerella volcania TaxID=2527984 RepID=A0A518C8K3_9BACT|nr:hypothetical protein [Bremerella volcania]QDU75557.1 hypothetical protein Pan97_25900 [Bremerella volcania]